MTFPPNVLPARSRCNNTLTYAKSSNYPITGNRSSSCRSLAGQIPPADRKRSPVWGPRQTRSLLQAIFSVNRVLGTPGSEKFLLRSFRDRLQSDMPLLLSQDPKHEPRDSDTSSSPTFRGKNLLACDPFSSERLEEFTFRPGTRIRRCFGKTLLGTSHRSQHRACYG